MNAELKKKWVKALRSGVYAQAKAQLRRETSNGVSFCCLGVLLCVSGTIRRFLEEEEEHYKFIDDQVGVLHRHELTRMNDRQDKSFNEIADYIEQSI
jgi:hypothetical protein